MKKSTMRCFPHTKVELLPLRLTLKRYLLITPICYLSVSRLFIMIWKYQCSWVRGVCAIAINCIVCLAGYAATAFQVFAMTILKHTNSFEKVILYFYVPSTCLSCLRPAPVYCRQCLRLYHTGTKSC